MRLGIGSYAYAWAIGVPGHASPSSPMDAFGLLERAAELGVHLVEICDNLPLGVLSPAERDALWARANELKIQITVGTRGIDREHLRRYVDLASFFASPILRIVIDTETHQPTIADTIVACQTLVPQLEKAGVCLAIENHDRFKADTFAEIVSRIDSERVGICLDTVNSFGALEGPERVVSTLAPWVVDLHIKDFAIYRAPHKMGFVIEGRPAGQGQLDVPWLLEALHDHGRDPDAVLESWPAPERRPENTVRKEDDWAREGIAYLRSLIPA